MRTRNKNKLYIGFDNGVSATIGFADTDGFCDIRLMPVKYCLDYTKAVKHINRIDTEKLHELLDSMVNDVEESLQNAEVLAILERPMVNPGRFVATASALRALEAVLITLEGLNIGYQFCDSREWQKKVLPSGIVGSDELKKASAEQAIRKYPNFAPLITKHKDADGLWIARWAMLSRL